MTYLSLATMKGRGDWISMTNHVMDSTCPLLAVVWIDQNRRYYISTQGTTSDGNLIVRTRHRNVDGGSTPTDVTLTQPRVVEQMHSVAYMVDRHNLRRMDILNLEKKLQVTDWVKRVATGMLGMLFVDAYLFYEGVMGEEAMSQKEWMKWLVKDLLHNSWDSAALVTRRSSHVLNELRQRESSIPSLPVLPSYGDSIYVTSLPRNSKNGRRHQVRCRICHKKVTNVCSKCGDFGICDPRTQRPCFREHMMKQHSSFLSYSFS